MRVWVLLLRPGSVTPCLRLERKRAPCSRLESKRAQRLWGGAAAPQTNLDNVLRELAGAALLEEHEPGVEHALVHPPLLQELVHLRRSRERARSQP